MNKNSSFKLLSSLQTIQDLFSEYVGFSIVFIDSNAKEITIPSKLPMICFNNEQYDEKCKACYRNILKGLKENSEDEMLYQCHKGLYIHVCTTNIKLNYQFTYLINGRVSDRSILTTNQRFLRALSILPFNISHEDLQNHSLSKQYKNIAYNLTPQEYSILKYLVEGLSNKEIANHLNISVSTVKIHVSNIIKKLHVTNRTEAAFYALKDNIVTIPQKNNSI
jgi:DNA-binding CsgD family transcriptional regulator